MSTDLKMAESNPDACTLRVYGNFYQAPGGGFIYPEKMEMQEKLNEFFRVKNMNETDVEVESKFTEINFNYLQNGSGLYNFLVQEEEFYVKVGSPEQMELILKFGNNFQVHLNPRQSVHIKFIKPSQKSATREAYRAIGNLLLCLKTVDQKCKVLEAIPGKGGVPMLPDQMVQKEQFDETVKAYEENIKDMAGKIGKSNNHPVTTDLHAYLCSKTRVDKRKRQTALDPLIDERIEILKKLAQFDTDEFPFTYEREFK